MGQVANLWEDDSEQILIALDKQKRHQIWMPLFLPLNA